MKRILTLMTMAALFGAAVGCAQSCLQHDCGWKELYARADLPARLDSDSATLDALITPAVPDIPDPATVLEPERTPHHLSLGEAFATALEHGTIGTQFARSPGLPNDDLVSFGGNGIFGSDSIRVLAMQPARAGAAVESALSRFDPQFTTGINWNTTDEPTQGLLTFSNGQFASFFASLAKPLPTGGVVGINYSTDYSLLSDPPVGQFGVVNPSYVPKLRIGFEQPLLRGFGTEINQLLPNSPGSDLFPALNARSNGFAPEGILIARLRFDQQRAELERTVNYLLLNVEAAYWNLYGAYVNLYATEQGLRQAQQVWVAFKARADVGQGLRIGQLAQVQAQYEQFRGDRMRAIGQILDSERGLRQLLGMPVEDGKRLVPVDVPTTAGMRPDWKSALADALSLRPELLLARQDLKARQWNIVLQKNFMLPDLRFQATHTLVGLGTRLDGGGTIADANGDPVTSNALRSLVGAHYSDWTVGLNLSVPLGYRREHANLRDARLQLAQGYVLLKNQEQKATSFLARSYSRVIETQRVLEIRKLQRESQAEQLRVRSEALADGKGEVEFLLTAQQQFASALTQEYQAIVDYNIALATFEFARGTIMQHSRVSIAEAPLPACAVRAVDHEHGKALTAIRNRPHLSRKEAIESALPPLPLYGAASLLDLGEGPESAPRSVLPAPTLSFAPCEPEPLPSPALRGFLPPIEMPQPPVPLPLLEFGAPSPSP